MAVTWAVPAAAMSLAGMAAVTCVALTKVVVRAAPFQLTVAPETKLLPLTVSVNAAPLAVAVFGESEVRAGGVTVSLPAPSCTRLPIDGTPVKQLLFVREVVGGVV
jgi:hypothetical protein